MMTLLITPHCRQGSTTAGLVLLDVGRGGAEREAHHRADPDAGSAEERRRERHPRRVDAHGCEPELGRLAAQLLDVGPRRVRLEQRVIDQPRHAARGAAGGVDTDPRRARLDHALQPRRAAVGHDRVAAAARAALAEAPAPKAAARGEHFLGDDVDQALQVLRIHGVFLQPSASSRRILISLRM
jgi:hypothetical protein